MNLQIFGIREFAQAKHIFEALEKGDYNSNDFTLDDTVDIHFDTYTGDVYLYNDWCEYLKPYETSDGTWALERYWNINGELMDFEEMCECYEECYEDLTEDEKEMIYEAWEERRDTTDIVLKDV